jgi:sodium-dependent dicarboxylate transporter 2/3/5
VSLVAVSGHVQTLRQQLEDTEVGDHLRGERQRLGPWTRGQVNTLLAFAATVLLWVSPGLAELSLGGEHPLARFLGTRLPEGAAALFGATLLFLLPTSRAPRARTLEWSEAVQIDWGTILLFGGGLSLGGLMFSTGLAETIGVAVTRVTGAQSLWGLTGAAIGAAILMSETT